MLPMPYRKEALENISADDDRQYPNIRRALLLGFIWANSPQKRKYWQDVIDGIESGRIKLNAISWPKEANWENAVDGTIGRCFNASGTVYFIVLIADEDVFRTEFQFAGFISNMEELDWKQSVETKPYF